MIHYDTLLQHATDIITKCDSYFITKCDRSLLQNVTVLLQNATFITNCDSTIVITLKSFFWEGLFRIRKTTRQSVYEH